MSSRLVKGLYGHEFKNTSRLFGLCCGQMRCPELVHNGGWYSRLGEKLGWGDLSGADLTKISQELEADELFVILHESASFWNFVKKDQIGIIGSMCGVEPTIEAPGIDFICEKAAFIVAPKMIYYVRHQFSSDNRPIFEWYGATMHSITRAEATKLIKEDIKS